MSDYLPTKNHNLLWSLEGSSTSPFTQSIIIAKVLQFTHDLLFGHLHDDCNFARKQACHCTAPHRVELLHRMDAVKLRGSIIIASSWSAVQESIAPRSVYYKNASNGSKRPTWTCCTDTVWFWAASFGGNVWNQSIIGAENCRSLKILWIICRYFFRWWRCGLQTYPIPLSVLSNPSRGIPDPNLNSIYSDTHLILIYTVWKNHVKFYAHVS